MSMLNELLDKYISEYIDDVKNAINSFDIKRNLRDLQPLDWPIYYEEFTKQKEIVSNYEVTTASVLLRDKYIETLSGDYEIYNKKLERHNEELESKLSRLNSNHSEELEDLLTRIKEREDELTSSISVVKNLHYNYVVDDYPDLKRIAAVHGISESPKPQDLSLDELEIKLRVSTEVAKLFKTSKGILERGISLTYLPLNLDSKGDDKTIAYFHFGILLILSIVFSPYFWGIIGIFYITAFLSNLISVGKRKLLVSSALAYGDNFNFDYIYDNDVLLNDLRQELQELQNKGVGAEESTIRQEYGAKLRDIEEYSPDVRVKLFEKEHKEQYDMISSKLTEATNVARMLKDERMKLFNEHSTKIDEQLDKLQNNLQLLGNTFTTKKTLDLDFKLGQIKVNNRIIAEHKDKMQLESINFWYNSEESKHELIRFMKLLLCNFLSNVHARFFKVTIFDPAELGTNYNEFRLQELMTKHIIFEVGDQRKFIKDIHTEIQNVMSRVGTSDIQEYNKKAEAEDKNTLDYHLVIFVPTDVTVISNKNYTALLKYSATFGVHIWTLLDERWLKRDNKEMLANRKEFDRDISTCKKPNEILDKNGNNLVTMKGDTLPYEYTVELGRRTTINFNKNRENLSVDILDYNKMLERHVPKDKYWTYSTDGGIEIHMGLVDGDPYNFHAHVFGDRTVNALMAGTTGSGKSVTINEALATMMKMYSPEELELVLVDFKNVEFAIYTGETLVPHASIIAGTKDGEYALSIFDYLLDEMRRRERLFTENRVKNISEYNTLVRNKGEDQKQLPRILSVFDEFQVMFTEVEPKIVDKIRGRITSISKLARFAGCHMWFTSQSMKGTLSADTMEQFKLRMALELGSTETSTAIIGNKAAADGTIKSIGWMITNDSGGTKKEANKLFRVPYLPTKEIKSYIKELQQKCKNEGHLNRNAQFYDEDKVHQGVELTDLYKQNPEFKEKEGTLFLGERTSFSLNTLPFGTKMLREDKDNIIIVASEREPQMNLVRTVIENCQQRNVIIEGCSADKDTIKLLGLPDFVDEATREFTSEVRSGQEAGDMLEALVEFNSQEETPPETFFFLLDVDKMEGIGAGTEDWKASEKIAKLLQKAGRYNIHIVITCSLSDSIRSWKNYISHKILSRCTPRETDSFDIPKAKKITSKFAIYSYNGEETTFKIYDFPMKGEIESREVKLD